MFTAKQGSFDIDFKYNTTYNLHMLLNAHNGGLTIKNVRSEENV